MGQGALAVTRLLDFRIARIGFEAKGGQGVLSAFLPGRDACRGDGRFVDGPTAKEGRVIGAKAGDDEQAIERETSRSPLNHFAPTATFSMPKRICSSPAPTSQFEETEAQGSTGTRSVFAS
jgi:hypothetical protein